MYNINTQPNSDAALIPHTHMYPNRPKYIKHPNNTQYTKHPNNTNTNYTNNTNSTIIQIIKTIHI